MSQPTGGQGEGQQYGGYQPQQQYGGYPGGPAPPFAVPGAQRGGAAPAPAGYRPTYQPPGGYQPPPG